MNVVNTILPLFNEILVLEYKLATTQSTLPHSMKLPVWFYLYKPKENILKFSYLKKGHMSESINKAYCLYLLPRNLGTFFFPPSQTA